MPGEAVSQKAAPIPFRLCGIRLYGTGKRTSLSTSRKEARYARHYCLA